MRGCLGLCPMYASARNAGSLTLGSLRGVGMPYPNRVASFGFPTGSWVAVEMGTELLSGGNEAPGNWVGTGVPAHSPPPPAASLPPASDPDFVVLDDSLHVRATYISGELVWQAEEARQ